MLNANKRGSVLDLFIIGAIITVFAISVLFGNKIMTEINTQVQNTDSSLMPTEAKTTTAALRGQYGGVIDNSFLFFVIGLAAATIALATLVRIHPVFIFFYFIALVLVVFFSGILSNVYQELAANTILQTAANELTFISLVMNYLPWFIAVFGTILMIIMHKARMADAI